MDQDHMDLSSALNAILHRVDRTLTTSGQEFPLFGNTKTGEWETTEDGNWCAGHWIGLLRLAAAHADEDTDINRFTTAAAQHTEKMRDADELLDSMFGGMNYLYAGHCLVEHLLNGRSSVERLIRAIMVVMVPEPPQPATGAGLTAPPKRMKAVDSHRHSLKPYRELSRFE